MFVLTTNPNLKSQLPEKVYGDLSIAKEASDWFGVGIDYRAVYSKILQSLYGMNPDSYFGGEYKLENYINTKLPNPVLFHKEFKNS